MARELVFDSGQLLGADEWRDLIPMSTRPLGSDPLELVAEHLFVKVDVVTNDALAALELCHDLISIVHGESSGSSGLE